MNLDGDPEGESDFADTSRIVRLFARMAERRGAVAECRRMLMTEMGRVLEADGWLWSATEVIQEQQRPVSVGVIHGGLTQRQFKSWLEASQIGSPPPPEDAPLTQRLKLGKHFTCTRQEVVADAVWYAHPTVKLYRLDVGIDHFLYSIYPVRSNRCSAVGFYRRVGRKSFTERQRQLCHLVIASVDWLHRGAFPGCDGRKTVDMSPRQRTVFIYLLKGMSRDEIAEVMHLSPQTIKTHTRSIYRHFGIGSQVELMRHLDREDAGVFR